MKIRSELAPWPLLLGAVLLAGSAGAVAAADLARPSYGELEPDRAGPSYGGRLYDAYGREISTRPRRRVTGGPGYVGSEYGLGKPSFYGIGTRPDWGRSSAD